MGYTREWAKVEIVQRIIAYTDKLNPWDEIPSLASLYRHKLMRLSKSELLDMLQDERQKWEERKIVMRFQLLESRFALEFEPEATMGRVLKFAHEDWVVDGEVNGIPTIDIDPQETIRDFCDKHIKPGCNYLNFRSHKLLGCVD